MAQLIEYKAACASGAKPAKGKVMLAKLYGKQVKLVLQYELDGVKSATPALVHYSTGQIVGNANNLKAIKALGHVSYKRMTDRAAAQVYLDDLTERVEEDRFFAVIAGAAILN